MKICDWTQMNYIPLSVKLHTKKRKPLFSQGCQVPKNKKAKFGHKQMQKGQKIDKFCLKKLAN
jgi:hypothetical protein